jgi:transcriptional regulator with XRE-family HTH domain
MTDFAARLREMRKSRKMSQEAFASLGRVTPNTQYKYEKGKPKPTMDYVLALAENGLDIGYLLTGQATHATEQEKAILTLLKALPEAQQAIGFGMLNMLFQTVAPGAAQPDQSTALWRAAHLYASFMDMSEAGRAVVEHSVSGVRGSRAQR